MLLFDAEVNRFSCGKIVVKYCHIVSSADQRCVLCILFH